MVKAKYGNAGHSVASKKTTLTDISDRRFIPEVINDNRGISCCKNEICTHEFTEHGKIDVPWWACFNETCAEHYDMKARNESNMKLPTVTILNKRQMSMSRKKMQLWIRKENTNFIGA